MNRGIKIPCHTVKTNAHSHPAMHRIYMCFCSMTNFNLEENTFCFLILSFVTIGICHFNGGIINTLVWYNETGCCVLSLIVLVPYCFWELWGYVSGLRPLFNGQVCLFFSIVVLTLFRNRNDGWWFWYGVEREQRCCNCDTKRHDHWESFLSVDKDAANNWGDGCVCVLMPVVFVLTLSAAWFDF
jgi:hypothetical protein